MKYAPIDSLVSAIRIPDPSDRAAWGEFLAFALDEHISVLRQEIDEGDENGPIGFRYTLGYHGETLVPGHYMVDKYSKAGLDPRWSYGLCDWKMIDPETFEADYVMTVPKPPFVREPIVEDPFAAPASFRSIPDKYHTFNADYREPPTEGLGVEGGFFTPPSAMVPATDEVDPF